jgi:hypothetical protein
MVAAVRPDDFLKRILGDSVGGIEAARESAAHVNSIPRTRASWCF